jgi:hypothetical protein
MNWNNHFKAISEGGFTFGNEVLPTLRVGSTDSEHVKQWQTIIGVTADGSFGTITENATKDWQRKHKLAADGVVGPVSWATALGTPKPVGKTSAAPTDNWAYAVAKSAAPSMPEGQRQYSLSVGRGEGYYGLGWTGPGAGSNNWGAVQGTGDAGSFQHIDHHADGKEYTTAFKRYSTPEAGYLDMVKYLLKPNVNAALAKGNLHDAVYAQHSNGYFELDPSKYLSAVVQNYTTLSSNVDGWKKILAVNGVSILGTLFKTVFGLALGAGLWYGYGKVKG